METTDGEDAQKGLERLERRTCLEVVHDRGAESCGGSLVEQRSSKSNCD